MTHITCPSKEHTMNPIKLSLTIITALLMLNACGTSTPSNSLSSEEAIAIGESVAIEAEDAVSELVIDDALDSLGLAASSAVISPKLTLPACAIPNPNPPADQDGDGVATNATYTYSCNKTGAGGRTFNLTGSKVVTDPNGASATNTTPGFDMTINNLILEVKKANGSPDYRTTRNGTRNPRINAGGIRHQHSLTTLLEVPGKQQATIVNNWLMIFNTAAGQFILPGQRLPDGDVNVTGVYSFTRAGKNYTLNLTTTVNLQHQRACAGQRFVAGKLKGALSGTGPTGTITIEFQPCGTAPIVTYTL
jgi:hypothetical protein